LYHTDGGNNMSRYKKYSIYTISTQEDKEKFVEYTQKILNLKEQFKKRGACVVKKETIKDWNKFIDKTIIQSKLEDVWYNGVIVEATLQCMEKLSQGVSIAEVYELINIQNPNKDCLYFEMKLSGWQNYSVTERVGYYHELGLEFCKYRNQYVKNPIRYEKKQLEKSIF